MTTKLTWLAAALVVLTATVAAAGATASSATKQQIAVEVRGGTDPEAFVLTPLGRGTLSADRGQATFCCWTNGHVLRAGQSLETGNPLMTLEGKRGTIVMRNHIVWMDIPDGGAVFTGTWKVVRATGAYAGLTGRGLAAGEQAGDGTGKSRFTGSLGR